MSQASEPSINPLVEALQRKCNHQSERIDELEETVEKHEEIIEALQLRLAEVEE